MKNYKIIFNDDKVEFVDETKYYRIVKDSGNPSCKRFQINNNYYRFADIRRMQEPEKNLFDVMGIDKMLKDRKPADRIKAIESMAKGVKCYIKSKEYNGTNSPVKLLELMRRKYAEARSQVN